MSTGLIISGNDARLLASFGNFPSKMNVYSAESQWSTEEDESVSELK